MKKLLLLTLTFMAAGATAFAQLPSFNLGLKAGVNIAGLKGDWADSDNRLGYQAGIWGRIGAPGFYVQPEVYLGSKGGEFGSVEQDGTTFNGKGKITFTTLDVPVLIGKKFGSDNLNLRIMAGPVVSFLLDKTSKNTFEPVLDFDNYKNQTVGAQFGAGVDAGNISVDLRYEAGISNVSKSSKYDQKQNLWHISLGYKLF